MNPVAGFLLSVIVKIVEMWTNDGNCCCDLAVTVQSDNFKQGLLSDVETTEEIWRQFPILIGLVTQSFYCNVTCFLPLRKPHLCVVS